MDTHEVMHVECDGRGLVSEGKVREIDYKNNLRC